MQIPQAAFCALEAYRWVARSAIRLQGYRFVKLMQQPKKQITVILGYPDIAAAGDAAPRVAAHPCLQIEGLDDKLLM